MDPIDINQLPYALEGRIGKIELILRVVPMPADCNPNGAIFGGWIMSHLDIAGATLAYKIAEGKVVTVAVNSLVFKQPVEVGDLLSFYGQIMRVGTTSITIDVAVFARRRTCMEDPPVKVTEATMTFVAIDDAGNPRPIPKRNAAG